MRSAASPAAIWALLSDITQMGRWSPEKCTDVTWVGEASGPLPGNRFGGGNRVGPLRWSTTCTLVATEPGRFLAFDAYHWSGATTRWTFELSPDGPGTRVGELSNHRLARSDHHSRSDCPSAAPIAGRRADDAGTAQRGGRANESAAIVMAVALGAGCATTRPRA
ncbi:SRPBCC family protein [Mycolicibacterium elephantis]|uniref:SRPBCC family protein n=1 Tax=Mycolicibacterium elephantis TaxID=81858 RepID=UPI0013FDFB6E